MKYLTFNLINLKLKIVCKVFILLVTLLTMFNCAKAEEIVIYNKTINKDFNASILNEEWKDENRTVSLSRLAKDGNIDLYYKEYARWDQKSADETLKITVPGTNDLNVNSDDYQDIRLSMVTLTNSLNSDFIRNDSLYVYVIGTDNNSYGPYSIYYSEPTGYYQAVTRKKIEGTDPAEYKLEFYTADNGLNYYYREYNIVTENLK